MLTQIRILKALKAAGRAQNPVFKEYWLKVADELERSVH